MLCRLEAGATKMLAGTQNSENRVAVVKAAPLDLEASLKIKRDKMRLRQYRSFGLVETILFELDRGGRYDPEEAFKCGRRLHWPHDGPGLGFTIPEDDLVFTELWPRRNGRVVLPDIPDPNCIVPDPYGLDINPDSGVPRNNPKSDELKVTAPRMIKQQLGKRASGVWGDFLVFQPVAQIIVRPYGLGPVWATMGTHRCPLTALSGYDDRKMALLVDPYSGEAFFTGGRYMQNQIEIKG